MNDLPAASTALPPPGQGWLPGAQPARGLLTNPRFLLCVLLVFALHLALIFLLGTSKRIQPEPAKPGPRLQLTDPANELVALTDPTLFARPNAHDLVSGYWRELPSVPQPNFDQLKATDYLPAPAPADFGSLFHEFVAHDRPAEFPLDFKPEPIVQLPDVTYDSPVPPASTMTISQELAHRRLLNTLTPPLWARNDVIGPSTVQVLVDTGGDVASAVVLNTSSDYAADQKALQLAASLRFAPARQPVSGEITFHWRTVPTNAPSLNQP